jgi:tetratricopeptide (TPR) repeat protein
MSVYDPIELPHGFWSSADVLAALDSRDIGTLLRLLRSRSGASQTRIGIAIGEPQPRVSVIMAGKVNVEELHVFRRIADGLDMPEEARRRLGVGHDNPRTAVARRSAAIAVAGTAEPATAEGTEEILRRIQWINSVNADDDSLDAFDLTIRDVVEQYESAGPAVLAGRVAQLRGISHKLLTGHQHPKQQARLYGIAAKLSGLLGYMAVNSGRPSLGRTYCVEAFQLAAQIDDGETLAWIRGTESLAAYYKGDYREALQLAQDGQRYAKNGPQSIRLALNGEARAAGKLLDAQLVNDAINRGFEALSRHGVTAEVGIVPCISFEPYDQPRSADNAATAYVSLGDTARVLEYADQADQYVEFSESDWSKSLVRLDVATAHVVADKPDVERAVQLGLEALSASAGKPITSIQKRSVELQTKMRTWSKTDTAREFTEALKEWSKSGVKSEKNGGQ